MQLAIVEYGRNVLGLKDANSTEFNRATSSPVIAMITEWQDQSRGAQLRSEAEGWALEWTYAVDQENWHRYQDACDRLRDDRSLLEGVTGFFFGHDDLPPEPRAVATPQPPGFAATARLADYSRC